MSSRQVGRSAPFRTISSPSRFPFRPPLSLTFAFRLQSSSSASTYLGPVLGARRNLGPRLGPCKGVRRRLDRNLRKFNYPHFHSRPCSLWITAQTQTLESRSAPLPPPGHLARRRLVHLGALLRGVHLERHAVGRRDRRNGIHLRRSRRVPDLPLR